MRTTLTSRPFVALGVLLVLLVILGVLPRLGVSQEIINLALGAAIAWSGSIVNFYFRKKDEG